jgi:hypothetical protein
VDAAQRLPGDEAAERLVAEGELADGEVALAAEAALATDRRRSGFLV